MRERAAFGYDPYMDNAGNVRVCRSCQRQLEASSAYFVQRRSGDRLYTAEICRECAAADRRERRSRHRADVVALHSPRVPDDPAWHAERRNALLERLAAQRARARNRRRQQSGATHAE